MAKLFTATSDYLAVSAAVVSTPPFSMHVWVKHTALGSLENLMSLGTLGSGNNRFYLSKTADDQSHAIERDTVSGQANSANLHDTNWHAYTGVFTTDSLRSASLDGGSTGTNSTARTPSAPDSLYFARSQSGSTNNFAGKLAYAAIWNRALTAPEIANLAIMTPLVAAPSGLVAYYILLSDALDTAGSNNLTVNGSAGYDTDMPALGSILPACAAINAVGQVPTILKYLNVAPSVGAVNVAGNAPAVLSNILTVSPGVGLISALGQMPVSSVATGPSGAPSVGALSIAGLIPSLLKIRIVVPDLMTGAIDEEGLAPTIVQGWFTAPGVGAVSMVGLQPLVIAQGVLGVNPLSGLATIAGLTPTLTIPAGQGGTAPALRGEFQMLGLAPSLQTTATVTPDPAQISFEGLAPVTPSRFVWHDSPAAIDKTWHPS